MSNATMNKLIPLALALTAIATPAQANGLHDFNPNVPSRTQLGKGTGECYSTKDGSKVCYLRLDVRQYVVAIHSAETGEYPEALYVNCNNGNWHGYGNLVEGQARSWATAVCRDND